MIEGGRDPSSLLSMPVASFVATGTACGRHSVAARARGVPSPLKLPPSSPARFYWNNLPLWGYERTFRGNRPPDMQDRNREYD